MPVVKSQYTIICAGWCSVLSCVLLFATPWTIAYQALLSIDFPGKNTGVPLHQLGSLIKG